MNDIMDALFLLVKQNRMGEYTRRHSYYHTMLESNSQYLDQLSAALDSNTMALVKRYATNQFAISNIEQEAIFRGSLAVGMELGLQLYLSE